MGGEKGMCVVNCESEVDDCTKVSNWIVIFKLILIKNEVVGQIACFIFQNSQISKIHKILSKILTHSLPIQDS